MRIIGIDVGVKYTGIALSDVNKTIAMPLASVEGYNTPKELAKKIKSKIENYEIEEIIMGNPKHMCGRESSFLEFIKETGKYLENFFKVPVKYWDERLSTKAVERVLIEANLSRKKRKKHINSSSALWILQGYIDFLNNKRNI